MFSFSKRKVFCIGFNKTGTSSLHNFFKDCGLTSEHSSRWPLYSHVMLGKYYYRKQCYSDGEQSNFARLQQKFPDSLFILNTRSVQDWLYSRVKHVMRFTEAIDMDVLFTDDKYGRMEREFYTDKTAAITKWYFEYKIYIQQARIYFQDKPNFIELDVTKDPGWISNLKSFFESNNFKYSHQEKEKLHSNSRPSNQIKEQDLLKINLAIVDLIINQDSITFD